jgi:hypothetical protein
VITTHAPLQLVEKKRLPYRRDVTNVWVKGAHLVQKGTVTTVTAAGVARRAQAAAEELFERRRALVGETPSQRSDFPKESLR